MAIGEPIQILEKDTSELPRVWATCEDCPFRQVYLNIIRQKRLMWENKQLRKKIVELTLQLREEEEN